MFSDKQSARIIRSKDSWIEGDAVRQLEQTSALDGIVDCVGLPDIHPGKYGPVGAAYLADGISTLHLSALMLAAVLGFIPRT